MKVADLKKELKKLGVDSSGRKAELVERLNWARGLNSSGLPPAGESDGGEVLPSHPAAAEDSKKRNLDYDNDDDEEEDGGDDEGGGDGGEVPSHSCSKCGKHSKTKSNVTRHEKTCGKGPGSGGKREGTGGKRKGAGSGGPRDGAGRQKGAAAAVEKGIGPGVDKVRKQHNLHKQTNKPINTETQQRCLACIGRHRPHTCGKTLFSSARGLKG